MKYKNIKDLSQRCSNHPAHQNGMVSHQMIQDRLFEEIQELREYITQRQWVGLTDEDFLEACQLAERGNYLLAFQRIQTKLKEKNSD